MFFLFSSFASSVACCVLGTSLLVVALVAVKLSRFIATTSSRIYPRRSAFPVTVLSGPDRGKSVVQSIFHPAQHPLSIVIPAYCEQLRIPSMLHQTILYLRDRLLRDPRFSAEIIVVDDGSPDDTVGSVAAFASSLPPAITLKLIRSPSNLGKGAVVAEGILSALGELILFADADGSTEISDLEKLEKASLSAGLICGSRVSQASAKNVVVKRSPFRRFLMLCFHFFVNLWGVKSVTDTQCGFKLMTRQAASVIAPNIHLNGWIFDIELVLLAEQLAVAIVEVPVNWTEVGGSKLCLAADSIDMALDLMFMRIAYCLGFWKVFGAGDPKSRSVPFVKLQ